MAQLAEHLPGAHSRPHLRALPQELPVTGNISYLQQPTYRQTDFFQQVGEPIYSMPSGLPEIKKPDNSQKPIPIQLDLFKRSTYVMKEKFEEAHDGSEILYATEIPITHDGKTLTGVPNEYNSSIFVGTDQGSTAMLIYGGDGVPTYGVFMINDINALRRHRESGNPLPRGKDRRLLSFQTKVEVDQFDHRDGQVVARGVVTRTKYRNRRVVTLIAPESAVGFASELRSSGTVQKEDDSGLGDSTSHRTKKPTASESGKVDLSEQYPVTFSIRSR